MWLPVIAASAELPLDTLVFGANKSEQAHALKSERSEVITGGLGEPGRRLLPPAQEDWAGGTMAFSMKVDPEIQNYLTIRLWGSDATANRLILYCEGKQVGYRHLGDIDLLDFGSDEPAYNSRFFYNTTPLPLDLTRGRTRLNCEIRGTGPIWGYGTTFAQYQKPMTVPTRGIYRVYTHTNGFFAPPPNEKQGRPPAQPPVRQKPGPEVFNPLRERVNHELDGFLASARPLNQVQMEFLAKAYYVKWTPAYRNQRVIDQVVKGTDALYAAYRANPRLAQADPVTANPEWFGLGCAGDAVRLLAECVRPLLDEKISDGAGATLTRRAAWSEMLQASREWHRRHRRLYTNQSMINDLFGIYLSNRGVAAIDPTNAASETEMRRYLYESVGLEPWRDSDPGGTGAVETGGRRWGTGTNYFELTSKGLTRELGFVGYYGEVLDWVTQIYDATRDLGQPGDQLIRNQLEKMVCARGVFRYPMLDAAGNRAMRIETVVGWRDAHYPGDVCYGERATWDASTIYAAAATLGTHSVGYAQQMFADNQFFASVEHQMKAGSGLRVTAGLLGVPDQYDLLKAQPASLERLPMSPGQPDFVWSDEEDGVVAVKNGEDIFYASLYWRARYGINFLARVHYITPRFDRIAVVREQTEFDPSGMVYTRPDWVNADFGNGGPHYPGNLHSAHTGEKHPIARIPQGVPFQPGDENVYAGKGSFYTLRYGPYLIGMNMTTDKTFELKPPGNLKKARELVSRKTIALGTPIKVGPRSTVVLYVGTINP
jgi:hypothetical protein